MTEVYLNSKFVGEVDQGANFSTLIREKRRMGEMDRNINILYDEQSDRVLIESDMGRTRRPLIVVKHGKPVLTDDHIKQLEKKELSWQDLVKHGVIEYLDALEEEGILVAFSEEDITPEHTHLEIAPLVMLGLCASLVPYGNFNQSTRLNAGAKNQKQALGFYAANYAVRMDMDVNIMHYTQSPIVNTLMHEIVRYEENPAGQNIVVAIMSYKGYNMEDAIILNEGSIQRGFGRSTYYRPSIAEELRYAGGLVDTIGIPEKDVKGYKTEKDYRLLDDDGIIRPEAELNEGDVIIGKTSPPRFLSSMEEYNLALSTRRESSVTTKHGERGIVDFVLLTENEEGNKLIEVQIRDTRMPEVGDKFTSRHGQKGVVGLIIPHADMPFSASGIVPDLIFSPHGIPSRMTIAHLIELIAGKVGSLSARFIDGTTFNAEPEAALRTELLANGFRENGTETFYNGDTGARFEAQIYVGNMYYLKLKHMVANKLHSRARGPIQLLTRQPTEGRAKEGGLRLGEMEKDTLVAHGSSMLLKERFSSDHVRVPVCLKSGLIGYFDARKGRLISPIYGEDSDMAWVEMSYAFKLLLDEIKSLGIYPKLQLTNKY